MKLETTRFGQIEYEPESVITFTQPILGFQEYRRFIFLPGPNPSLKWIQSTDSGDLAFILIDPSAVIPDYRVDVRPQDLAELAVATVDELEAYTLVVVPKDPAQVRTNLRAPILISPKHRLGKQIILDRSEYPIQHFLAQAQRGQGQSREVSNARTDA
ncbi:MAG: flagellar assembly protein FliW [bacterium]|nr:flagellar assembly protein FliW [bacterium]